MITLTVEQNELSAQKDGRTVNELFPFQDDEIRVSALSVEFGQLLDLVFAGKRLDDYTLIYRNQLNGKSLHAICRSVQEPSVGMAASFDYLFLGWNTKVDQDGWFDMVPKIAGINENGDSKKVDSIENVSPAELKPIPFYISEKFKIGSGLQTESVVARRRFRVRHLLSAIFSDLKEV